MILTQHGIDSLRNGNIIYELNINKFDPVTGKDGKGQWGKASWTNRQPDIIKHQDYLEFKFTAGPKQGYGLKNTFGLCYDIRDFYIDIAYSGNFTTATFLGPLWSFELFCGHGDSFSGFWRHYNNNWSAINKELYGNPLELTFHFVRNGNNNYLDVEVFKDDLKIVTSKCSLTGDSQIYNENVDYNGSSSYASVHLHKYKIYTK